MDREDIKDLEEGEASVQHLVRSEKYSQLDEVAALKLDII